MKKRIIGKFYSFKFQYQNAEHIYEGYVIDYNEDWTLLKYNVADYVMDGYIILKNQFITAYRRDREERFKQKIFDLKGCKPTENERIPITDIQTIFKYLSNRYGIFQFKMRTSTTCWLGCVKWIKGNDMKIDYLNPKAVWSSEMPKYKLGNIRTIEFDTDYINSLMLVAKKKRRKIIA